MQKFNGEFPSNISVMTYFNFLYSFCYKPFLADKVRAKGITYESNELISIKKSDLKYYLTSSGYFFSNRLALSFEYFDIIDDIKKRIEKYFDELLIDEIQDISGRDFNFLLKIMESQVNILFVGDFFQHTYDTSRDGNVNKNLFKDYNSYKDKFVSNGFIVDDNTFDKSWRCNNKTCKFIRDNLDIEIYSHHISDDNSRFQYIDKESEIKEIFNDENIIKLHYSNSKKYGYTHENWGDVKGEDCYKDICIILNEKTEKLLLDNSLDKLPAFTKNKLYVALTRARNNTFLISYKNLKYIKK